MNRAKESSDWGRFARKAFHEGYELITRFGNPAIMYKKDTPFTRETVWFCFFRKKNGSFSKNQRRGMEVFSAMGMHVLKWPERKI